MKTVLPAQLKMFLGWSSLRVSSEKCEKVRAGILERFALSGSETLFGSFRSNRTQNYSITKTVESWTCRKLWHIILTKKFLVASVAR